MPAEDTPDSHVCHPEPTSASSEKSSQNVYAPATGSGTFAPAQRDAGLWERLERVLHLRRGAFVETVAIVVKVQCAVVRRPRRRFVEQRFVEQVVEVRRLGPTNPDAKIENFLLSRLIVPP